MKNIIQFSISSEEGIYTAEGVNIPIITEGKTFEELKNNILDAVRLFFKGENHASLGLRKVLSKAYLTRLQNILLQQN